MEGWGFIDERELQGWKGAYVCITCQHFTHGVDQHWNAGEQQLIREKLRQLIFEKAQLARESQLSGGVV